MREEKGDMAKGGGASGAMRSVFILLWDRPLVEEGGAKDGAAEAAGQLSGESRREGSSEDTRRVSGCLEGVRQPVLHHKSHGRIGTHLSDESLVGNRGQAGKSVFAESREAQVLNAHELLRANGGARRA